MKKVIRVFIIIFLSIFSFYYSNKIIYFAKQSDPIMKNILNASKEYKVLPVNGTIKGDSLIVGVSGKDIDIDTSYEKMKKLDEYSKSFLEYTEIKPTI